MPCFYIDYKIFEVYHIVLYHTIFIRAELITFVRHELAANQCLFLHCVQAFSNWPTFPQLYVKGELMGGCDIVLQMKVIAPTPSSPCFLPQSARPRIHECAWVGIPAHEFDVMIMPAHPSQQLHTL